MELQYWRELLSPYALAVDELEVKFTHIQKEFRQSGQYSPIEAVQGRVKSLASIIEKANRRDIELCEVSKKMNDLAGIRITCQFIEDIYRVVAIIRDRTDMKVFSEEDYIKDVKSSGYRSYHMNVWYEVQTIKGNKAIMVEIQIRTLAMDFWATIEHSLRYKYGKMIPDHVIERLNATASATILLDNVMSDIRDEVVSAEQLFREKDAMVTDILNNIDNLFNGNGENANAVSNIQQEFYQIYESGDYVELQKFSKQLDDLAAKRKIQSLNL